jgi:hypothetical protein
MAGTADLYQITLHTALEKNDYVAYTTRNPWNMPKDVWTGLATHVQDSPVEITLRAIKGGPPGEAKTTIKIAPVEAGGNIVYWASNTSVPGLTTSALYGFHPGDDGVALTLNPGMIKQVVLDDSPKQKRAEFGAPAGQSRCVGCHASAPDGAAVAITNHWPWNVSIVSIDPPASVGQQPPYVTALGSLIAQVPWQGITTFSSGDGWPTRTRYVSSFAPRTSYDVTQPWNFWNNCGTGCNVTNKDDLFWVDLAAQGTAPAIPTDPNTQLDDIPKAILGAKGTGWDIIARGGDTRAAIAPRWSHDGQTIAYTSTDKSMDGRIGAATVCDIYTVPFGAGKGGAAAPVTGANDPAAAEYYPDYSADDKFLAFNRVASPGGKDLYYRPDGEIYVVPAAGGTPLRLSANDPPACTSETSPGIVNSWPKWSPVVRQGANGKSYYFLVFSSVRQTWGTIQEDYSAEKRASQLYIAAVVVDSAGNVENTPGIFLWNQRNLLTGGGDGGFANVTDLQTSNVTPAWNEFVLPPQPPADIK